MSFLPQRLAHSSTVRLPQVTTTVRFIIDDVDNGQWVCRFEDGQLAHMHRGSNGLREDFAYRTDERSFRAVVGGHIDPQQLFLSGRAEIEGDAEKALKMAMIFQAFTSEFPADAASVHEEFINDGS
jgi:predicted lipid carrier protein YhbT